MRSKLSDSSPPPPGEDSRRSGKQPPTRQIEASNESGKRREKGSTRRKDFWRRQAIIRRRVPVYIRRSPSSECETRVTAGIHNGFHVRKQLLGKLHPQKKNYLRFVCFCFLRLRSVPPFMANIFRFAFLAEPDDKIQKGLIIKPDSEVYTRRCKKL